MSGTKPAAPTGGPEVVGEVKRLLRRKTSVEDRAGIDATIHSLLAARLAVELEHQRAVKAARKLKTRLDAIDGKVVELHGAWGEVEREAIVRCRVERTETELVVIRLDNNLVHFRRKLTPEEHAALGPHLPNVDRPRVDHPELVEAGAVAEAEAREAEQAHERTKLTKAMSLDDAFAEVDADAEEASSDSEDAPPPEPKKKASKKAAKQGELDLAAGKDAKKK